MSKRVIITRLLETLDQTDFVPLPGRQFSVENDYKGSKPRGPQQMFMREGSAPSLRKHPFLLALRETSPAAKSKEKRMFSQATPPRGPTPYPFIYLFSQPLSHTLFRTLHPF